MAKDVRKEQVTLLRFEKKLAALAAFVATGAATTASASSKIDPKAAEQAYADIQEALIHLADVTTKAHASLESIAQETGARALFASGGEPKPEPPAVLIRSILGLG